MTLVASDGTDATATAGWSNFNIGGGGDFGIVSGSFDHHSSNYYHVISGCTGHYLMNLSTAMDTDAAYKSFSGLGAWSALSTCNGNEGSDVVFYAAMR